MDSRLSSAALYSFCILSSVLWSGGTLNSTDEEEGGSSFFFICGSWRRAGEETCVGSVVLATKDHTLRVVTLLLPGHRVSSRLLVIAELLVLVSDPVFPRTLILKFRWGVWSISLYHNKPNGVHTFDRHSTNALL